MQDFGANSRAAVNNGSVVPEAADTYEYGFQYGMASIRMEILEDKKI